MKSYLLVLQCFLISCCHHLDVDEDYIEETYIHLVDAENELSAGGDKDLSKADRMALNGSYIVAQFNFFCAAKPLSRLGLKKFTRFYSQLIERHGSVDFSAETMFMFVERINCELGDGG